MKGKEGVRTVQVNDSWMQHPEPDPVVRKNIIKDITGSADNTATQMGDCCIL